MANILGPRFTSLGGQLSDECKYHRIDLAVEGDLDQSLYSLILHTFALSYGSLDIFCNL